MTTRSTLESAAATLAALASPSSASTSTIAHTATPNARQRVLDTGNCASSTGSMPALVLYPSYRSLRNDSTT